jgi:hypothetical protein
MSKADVCDHHEPVYDSGGKPRADFFTETE